MVVVVSNVVFFIQHDISSILEVTLCEHQHLMSPIWVRDFPRDYDDPITDGIMAHLRDDKRIFWKDSYDIDVAARAEKHAEE